MSPCRVKSGLGVHRIERTHFYTLIFAQSKTVRRTFLLPHHDMKTYYPVLNYLIKAKKGKCSINKCYTHTYITPARDMPDVTYVLSLRGMFGTLREGVIRELLLESVTLGG